MKKKFKPVYIVDVTDCTNDRSIVVAFVEAKVNAGLPITEDELYSVVCDHVDEVLTYAVDLAAQTIPTKIELVNIHKAEKKPNVFKRFWNWITRKK